jgi:predicted dehydrogenase
MSLRMNRRRFLQGSAAALGYFYTASAPSALRAAAGPNGKIYFAGIGIGGKGSSDITHAGKLGEVIALCDIDENNLDAKAKEFPSAKRYFDFRKMLQEMKQIDAVTVSTPDHTHAPASIMAMKLKKHVYCQKPLTHTVNEARQMREVAKQMGVATQMGNQGSAANGLRRAVELVQAGVIGPVKEAHVWTNRPVWPQAPKVVSRPPEAPVPAHVHWEEFLGPAPFRPYAVYAEGQGRRRGAYHDFNWRGWWDFGTGALGDIACHSMDASFWVLDLGYPTRIEPESTKLFSESAPAVSRITYTFAAKGNRPEVKVVWRDGSLYPSRPKEVVDPAAWPFDTSGQLWIGDQGKLVAGIYGEEPRLPDEARQAEITAHPPAQRYPRLESVYAEWIAACKGGTPAGSNFPGHAGPLTEMVLLGNLAVRTAQVLEIDSHSGEIANTKIPAEYVRSEYRPGWSV